MKSKIILGIIAIILLVFAFGCGKDKDDSEPSPVPAQEVTEPIPAVPDLEEQEIPDEGIADIEKPSLEASAEEETPEAVEPEQVETISDEGVTDVSEDEPLGDEDLTAKNFKVISLKDLKAYPSEMIIKVGTTVEWRNVNDNFQHIIGWKDQKAMGVKAEPILIGQSWSYTFNEPRVVKWFSTAKPTIQGTITIEAEKPVEAPAE